MLPSYVTANEPSHAAFALYVAEAFTEHPGAPVDSEHTRLATAPPKTLAPLPEARAGWPGFESHAMALHTQHGQDVAFQGWFQLLVPALAGQPITGLQLALAAADYSSGGTAVMLSLKKWSFLSLDLTVNLIRRPVGEWVGLQADRSTLGDGGVGVRGVGAA